ncbi:MAG: hypothetical protein LUQ13_00950, partial [Methanomicrobiales archaeon]|nr:hypothetical protein [Methanomicrobiales archaeon]
MPESSHAEAYNRYSPVAVKRMDRYPIRAPAWIPCQDVEADRSEQDQDQQRRATPSGPLPEGTPCKGGV